MKKNKFYNIENKIDKIVFATENNIEKHYKVAADALKKEMADLYEKHGELSNSTMSKYRRLDDLYKKLGDTTQMVYKANRSEINAGLRAAFVDTEKSTMVAVDKDGKRRLQGITKSKKVTEVINSKVKNLDWRDRMGKHQGDLLYDLKKEIGSGIENGDTYQTVAKRIQKTFDVNESKAKSIARNETARVKSVSQKDTLDNIAREGIKMTKTWRSIKDERSRHNHAIMDGVTIPYEDNFSILGKEGPGPRLIDDDNGEENIGCRCYLVIDFVKSDSDGGTTN